MSSFAPLQESSTPSLRAAFALTLGLVVATGCKTNPQRVTAPLGNQGAPVGEALPGATEAIVLRHADPVYVRRAGAAGAFPLAFWRKRERVRAGAWITNGGGGRAELLWPGTSSSVVMFEDGSLEVGDTVRDEPLVRLHLVTHVRLILTPEDSVELAGGAILRGDPLEVSGPFVVQRLDSQTLRIVNQSKRTARVEYRDELLEFASGEVLELVALAPDPSGASRTRPSRPHPDSVSLATPVGTVQALGGLQRADQGGEVRFTATENAEIEGLGLRVRLVPGEEVLFTRFAPGSP